MLQAQAWIWTSTWRWVETVRRGLPSLVAAVGGLYVIPARSWLTAERVCSAQPLGGERVCGEKEGERS